MVKANAPQTLVDSLIDGGYGAVLKKDSSGDPLIIATVEKATIGVIFGGCKNNIGCSFVTLYFGLSDGKRFTLDEINKMNTRLKFARLYLDDSKDPALTYDVNLSQSGMTRSLFNDTVDWFRVASLLLVEQSK